MEKFINTCLSLINMENKKIDLEEILRDLLNDLSPEARSIAIRRLLQNGVNLPTYWIERTIGYYRVGGRINDAADTALEAGMIERAIEIYEEEERFIEAAIRALRVGMKEKARQLCERAIEIYEEGERLIEDADVAFRDGSKKEARELCERAIKICERTGWLSDKLACKVGMEEKIKRLYPTLIKIHEKRGAWGEAANVARKAGMIERAIKDYINAARSADDDDVEARMYEAAADLARKIGRKKEAEEWYQRVIRIREKRREFEKAADVAHKAGMEEKAKQLYQEALEIYKKTGKFKKAANVARKIGREEEARQLKTLADLIVNC